jgi:hypothetical protein
MDVKWSEKHGSTNDYKHLLTSEILTDNTDKSQVSQNKFSSKAVMKQLPDHATHPQSAPDDCNILANFGDLKLAQFLLKQDADSVCDSSISQLADLTVKKKRYLKYFSSPHDVTPLHKWPPVASESISSGDRVKQFHADVCEVKFANERRIRYILVVQDVSSHHIYLRPLRRSPFLSMSIAMESVFNERKCQSLATDMGREFCTRDMLHLYEEYDIIHVRAHRMLGGRCLERNFDIIRHSLETLFRLFQPSHSSSYDAILQEVAQLVNDLR